MLLRATHFMSLREVAHYGDPKRYFCTFGEKAHTGVKVSVIACNNAISKVQCAPYGRVSTFFPCRACFYCFLYNCQYDTLAKYMTDCNNFRNHINH